MAVPSRRSGRGALAPRCGARGGVQPCPRPFPAARPHTVLTLVAVAHGAEVHVVLVVGEEEEAEPGVEGVDGHDEEDADDVALLVGAAVAAQVHVDLRAEGPSAQPRPSRSPAPHQPASAFCSTREGRPRTHLALPPTTSVTMLFSPEPQRPPL